MAKTPAQQILANAGAIACGMTFGVTVGFCLVFFVPQQNVPQERILTLVVCLLLIAWRLTAIRPLGLMLGSALFVIATFLGIIAGARAFFNMQMPHPYEDALAKAPQFLHECAPNEIRVVYFGNLGTVTPNSGSPAITSWKVDLATGNWTEAYDWDSSVSSSDFLYSSADEFHHPYTARQIDKIKGLIAALPRPRWKLFFFDGSFENQIHFAFYRDNTLHVYDYSQDEAKSEREGWAQIFQMQPGDP